MQIDCGTISALATKCYNHLMTKFERGQIPFVIEGRRDPSQTLYELGFLGQENPEGVGRFVRPLVLPDRVNALNGWGQSQRGLSSVLIASELCSYLISGQRRGGKCCRSLCGYASEHYTPGEINTYPRFIGAYGILVTAGPPKTRPAHPCHVPRRSASRFRLAW